MAPSCWLRPASAAGPGQVRILRFYASTGAVTEGQSAQLCYGVLNAKAVRIAPPLANVYPAASRCLEIVPKHTTHYTIWAEGFDGRVAVQSLTVPVEPVPAPPRARVDLAVWLPGTGVPR